MGFACSVCIHPENRDGAIDRALTDGKSLLKDLADEFSLSTSALGRHRDRHCSPVLFNLAKLERIDQIMAKLTALEEVAHNLLHRLQSRGDAMGALQAVKVAASLVELSARLTGELKTGSTHLHLHSHPQWIQMRAVMFTALAPFPEASHALQEALLQLDEAPALEANHE